MKLSVAVTLFLVIERIAADIDDSRPPGLFPEDYDKYEPPWTEEEPAHVYLQLEIMDIDKINDGDMDFSIQSYLNEMWKDKRLNLSSFTEDEDLTPIFPSYLTQYIWVPDLVFDNTKSGTLFPLSLPNQSLKVLKDGTFYRISRYNMLVGCQMDFRFYPMDTQHCFMKISTLSNIDKKVLLHWSEELPEKLKSVLFKNNIEPLKYMLNEPKTYKTTEVWTSGNFTYLYANFTFVRRLSGSLFNIYVPSTLVVFLSWISFWLDAEAVPARVTLGVTSLLTLGTQIVQAHSGLPAISYMTAVDVWLFACLISVFCSLLEFAISYQLFIISKQSSINNESKAGAFRSPKVELRILKSRIIQDSIFRDKSSDQRNSSVSEKFHGEEGKVRYLDRICRKLFPFFFIVFNIAYWTNYLL